VAVLVATHSLRAVLVVLVAVVVDLLVVALARMVVLEQQMRVSVEVMALRFMAAVVVVVLVERVQTLPEQALVVMVAQD
jgi:hypothetical protein